MLFLRLLVIITSLVFSNYALAEIYKDFTPYISLKKIKENYPNAKFEEVKAAWVTKNEAFIKLTGSGLAGTTYLALSTSDSYWQKVISDSETKIAENPNADNIELLVTIDSANKFINEPLDEKLTLNWLRWAPDSALPLERLINRYGNPDVYGVDDESFQQFCNWTKRRVRAMLSDDKKMVFSIEYGFTLEENNRAMGINEPEATKLENKTPPARNKKKKVNL